LGVTKAVRLDETAEGTPSAVRLGLLLMTRSGNLAHSILGFSAGQETK